MTQSSVQFETEACVGTVRLSADWDERRQAWCFWLGGVEYCVAGCISDPPVKVLQSMAGTILNPSCEPEEVLP